MVVSRQALRCREEAESGRELREALQGVSINTAQPALTTVIHRTQQRWARAGCSTRRFPASELLEVLVLWRASSHRLELLIHRPVLHEPPSAIPRRASPQRVLRCSLLHDSSSGGASGQLAAGVALRAHLLGSARTRRCLAIASRAPRHVLIGRSTGGVGLTAESVSHARLFRRDDFRRAKSLHFCRDTINRSAAVLPPDRRVYVGRKCSS
jgi:hypothetical protein